LKFTVKLTEVLNSISPLGDISAAQNETAPARRGKKKRAAKEYPPATKKCITCTSANMNGWAAFAAPGCLDVDQATHCASHKLAKYCRVAYGGAGGRSVNIEKEKWVQEGRGTQNQYYHRQNLRLQNDLKKQLMETKQELKSAQDHVLNLQHLVDQYSNGKSLDIETIRALQDETNRLKENNQVLTMSLESTTANLKEAQTQRNAYKQAYEEMEVRYKELLNNQG